VANTTKRAFVNLTFRANVALCNVSWLQIIHQQYLRGIHGFTGCTIFFVHRTIASTQSSNSIQDTGPLRRGLRASEIARCH